MSELADESGEAERELQAWTELAELVADRLDPALWAVAPKLATAVTGVDQTRATRWRGGVRAVVRGRFGQGPRIALARGVALVSTSAGQRRTLAPIELALGDSAPAILRLPPAVPRREAAAWQRARTLTPLVDRWATAHGLHLAEHPAVTLLDAGIARVRAERWLDGGPLPKAVVVASQHNAVVRAVLEAARQRGVPTVYVPHAPVADVPWYRDLPVDLALLRGEGERDFYVELGAAPDGLVIVGDPSIETDAGTGVVDHDAPLLWATSPHPRERLAAVAGLLADAALTVEVAPHPRADRRLLADVCPPTWSWSAQPSTSARLASGPVRAVVQHRSGMGLEALRAGIPVVEICAPGRRPPYAYLEDGTAALVSSSEQLVSALGSTPSPAALAERASRWCAEVGRTAIAAVVAQVAVSELRPRAILDGWASAPD